MLPFFTFFSFVKYVSDGGFGGSILGERIIHEYSTEQSTLTYVQQALMMVMIMFDDGAGGREWGRMTNYVSRSMGEMMWGECICLGGCICV